MQLIPNTKPSGLTLVIFRICKSDGCKQQNPSDSITGYIDCNPW